MTTVGEFVQRQKQLYKRATANNSGKTSFSNNITPALQFMGLPTNMDEVHTLINNNPSLQRGLEWGLDKANVYSNGAAGKQFGAFVDHGRDPIYRGTVPAGENKYRYLANQIFGGTPDQYNPYLNYFEGKNHTNYTDMNFMFDLKEIMNSNPQVAAMVMHNVMAGNKTLPDMLLQQARNTQKLDPEDARRTAKGARYLYDQLNTLGHTFAGPDLQGNIFRKQYLNSWDKQKQKWNKGSYGWLNGFGSKYLFDRWKEGSQNANFPSMAQEYNKNVYQPNVGDKRLEQNFYGAFANPGFRQATRYAAPWIAYGIPIATAGSAMGNNDLWGLVGAGMLGGAGYGYASGNGYIPQYQVLDNLTSMANTPWVSLLNKALPEGLPFQEAFLENTNQTQAIPQNTGYTQQQTPQNTSL